MALNKNTLKNELRKIMDPDFDGFEGFPQDSNEVAERWGSILNNYLVSITPLTTTLSIAISKFKLSLQSINNVSGLIIFQASFTQLALELGLGMQPGFTATPPPIPINLSLVSSLGLSGASGEETSNALGDVIDSWFKTGIAINNSTSITVNWF